jgi:hypothetical protein
MMIDVTKELMAIDILHTNLVVLSKILPGDKLTLNSDILNIDRSYFQWVKRWYNMTDRINTIQFVGNVIDNTFLTIDNIVADKTFISLSSETRDTILQRFTIELKNSIGGLINLKTTYINDNSITSSIDVIIENITNKVTTLNNLLRVLD